MSLTQIEIFRLKRSVASIRHPLVDLFRGENLEINENGNKNRKWKEFCYFHWPWPLDNFGSLLYYLLYPMNTEQTRRCSPYPMACTGNRRYPGN